MINELKKIANERTEKLEHVRMILVDLEEERFHVDGCSVGALIFQNGHFMYDDNNEEYVISNYKWAIPENKQVKVATLLPEMFSKIKEQIEHDILLIDDTIQILKKINKKKG